MQNKACGSAWFDIWFGCDIPLSYQFLREPIRIVERIVEVYM